MPLRGVFQQLAKNMSSRFLATFLAAAVLPISVAADYVHMSSSGVGWAALKPNYNDCCFSRDGFNTGVKDMCPHYYYFGG